MYRSFLLTITKRVIACSRRMGYFPRILICTIDITCPLIRNVPINLDLSFIGSHYLVNMHHDSILILIIRAL